MHYLRSILLVATISSFFLCPGGTSAQSPQRPPQKDQSDVVRVYTELVQTDVTVFDKQGKFANDLRREDFELRIDGKAVPIDFFERITAGSVNEESQLAAARGSANPSRANSTAVVPLDRGRTIFFFVDDMHLNLSGATLTRKLISQFIDNEMGQNDQVAITSTTGQIGFLQQLTDNHTVLHRAVERLKPGTYTVTDNQRPPMTEYQAILIERYDHDTTDYFVEALLRDIPMLQRETAESMVRGRAHGIVEQAANITRATLSSLESLIRSSGTLPGRKVVFFISNGFFTEDRTSDSTERVQRLASSAARSGVVIYSMDSRGLVTGLPDASSDVAFDPTGRLDAASHGELIASQDGLNALARDTGGRAIFNTNSLEPGLKNALKETSTYYLLAWKPESGSQGTSKFRKIDVRLVNKPNLTVRVRRGFYDVEPPPPANAKNSKTPPTETTTPEAKLREAIFTPYPHRSLPIALSLSFVTTPDKRQLLSTSMQIPGELLSFASEGDKGKAVVDLAGFVYDEKGRVGAKFTDKLTLTMNNPAGSVAGSTNNPNKPNQDITYNFPVYLSAGLYQVRVGARDEGNGKIGSAHGWIEIPDLSTGELAMSSLLIGERSGNTGSSSNNTTNISTSPGLRDPVTISVDRRFHRDSYLRFLIFIYNATRAPDGKPDAAVQVQLIRDNQPVMTTALRKIETEGVEDLWRLPYAADVPLSELSPGNYMLHVSVVDRISKRSTSQRAPFEID